MLKKRRLAPPFMKKTTSKKEPNGMKKCLDALIFMVVALRKASLMSGQSSAVRFFFFGSWFFGS